MIRTSRFSTFLRLLLLAILLAAIPSRIVQADAGPHPSMQFTFISRLQPAPVILSGQLLECEDEACTRSAPLSEMGPQRFECRSDSCYSSGYSYSPYHRLVIEFFDGVTRQSNVFTKEAFAANYRVTVYEESLSVEERPLGPNIPFFKAGAPTLLDLLATLAFPLMEIILPILLVGLAVKAGRAGATPAAYYTWLDVAWILSVPAILAGMMWTRGLIVTLVVELLLGAGYVLWRKRPLPVVLTVILLLNLITQPVLWISISGFSGMYPFMALLLAEGIVWLVEAVGLYLSQRSSMKFSQALLVSLALNAASFVVGGLLIG